MEAENFSIPIAGKGTVAGSSYGQGPRMVICFHGYGQSRKLFQPLLSLFPTDCRMILLDLPFFGESDWSATQPVLPSDLEACLQALLQRYPAVEVDLLAFSLGAKLALSLYQVTQVPIRQMVLISPDGLRIHPVYRFCIYNPIGQALFYTVLRWPALFLFILKVLYKLRITDPFKYRFIKIQFDAAHKRQLLKRVWQGNARIRPDISKIAARSASQSTAWHIIWGAEDDVLPMKLCKDFIGKVNGAKLHLVQGGHFLLSPARDDVKSLLQSILHT